MIYTVILAKSAQEAQDQLDLACQDGGVELRLDFWDTLDYTALNLLRQKSTVPLIFTLRNVENGGRYDASEAERLLALVKLAELCQHTRSLATPDYLDIEHTVPVQFLADLKKQFPTLNIIRSYHNFDSTPENLDALLDELLHPAVSVYKLATQANSTLDGLRMLNLLQQRSSKQHLVGLCLGELGKFTRVLSPIVGGAWMYAANLQSDSLPPGIMSVTELRDVYHFDQLNRNTAIYGLIGDPVEHSVGAIFHNAQFAHLGHDAVYVKLKCGIDELEEFFRLAKVLNIRGLSVTMPLKSFLLPFISHSDNVVKALGVANTLNFKDEGIEATNTDAPGAIAAIQKHTTLKNKNVLIIGAGGAAKAIAYATINAGPNVTLINRSVQKARLFADEFNCAVLTSEQLADTKHDFSIVINTLPCYPETQEFINHIVTHCLSPTTIAMDCVYSPAETIFIKAAQKIGSSIIYGKELFEQQALRQLEVWGILTPELDIFSK